MSFEDDSQLLPPTLHHIVCSFAVAILTFTHRTVLLHLRLVSHDPASLGSAGRRREVDVFPGESGSRRRERRPVGPGGGGGGGGAQQEVTEALTAEASETNGEKLPLWL